MPVTTSAILKKIGCQFLEMQKGEGYWYFIYDDLANNHYETHSVYCYRLNQMTLDQWVEEGKDFVALMEKKLAERLQPNYKNMTMIFKNMEK